MRDGTWAEKSMYGKKFWGALRATFVIDADGTVARVFPKVSPKTHDDQVLAALAEASTVCLLAALPRPRSRPIA